MVLYHPNGEGGTAIESYAREYSSLRPGNRLHLLSLDTPEGADTANLYGISQYPALMVVSDDGHLLRLWQGQTLPLMSELSAYAS